MVSVSVLVPPTILGLALSGFSFFDTAPHPRNPTGTELLQQLVIQKEGSREYHRPWCSVVRDGKDVLALTQGQATARGLKSHAACEKDPSADVPTPTGSSGRKPAPPVFVYIDGGKYYHRESCAKGVGPFTRVALETAGRKRWPCPSCRPPLRKKTDAPAVPKRGGRD